MGLLETGCLQQEENRVSLPFALQAVRRTRKAERKRWWCPLVLSPRVCPRGP